MKEEQYKKELGEKNAQIKTLQRDQEAMVLQSNEDTKRLE